MQARVTPQQFEEWRAFDKVHPFGDDWRRTATIAAAAQQPYAKSWIDPNRFLPARAQPKPVEQTEAEQERILRSVIGE